MADSLTAGSIQLPPKPMDCGGARWKTIVEWLYLMLCFFLAIHDFQASTWDINRPADFFAATSGSGSAGTKAAFLLLGAYGLHGLLRRGSRRLYVSGLAGFFALLLLCWTLMSFLWAQNPVEPMGRLAGILALALTATRLRRNWDELACVRWMTATTLCFATIGVVTELALRTFRPWDIEYRFSGTLHPNAQGVNCSIAMLGACCLAWAGPRRKLWLGCAGLAFTLDLLTKSRTSVISLILAAGFAVAFSQRDRRRSRLAITTLGLLLFLGAWCYQAGLLPSSDALQLGRDTYTSNNSNLTGRLPLWAELMVTVERHPLLGEGYGAFWTPANIERISGDQGWGITAAHSAYMDILLALGAVGVVLYGLTIVFSVFAARRRYLASPTAGAAFFGILLVFIAIDGFSDSEPVIVSAFLCFCLALALAEVAFIRFIQPQSVKVAAAVDSPMVARSH